MTGEKDRPRLYFLSYIADENPGLTPYRAYPQAVKCLARTIHRTVNKHISIQDGVNRSNNAHGHVMCCAEIELSPLSRNRSLTLPRHRAVGGGDYGPLLGPAPRLKYPPHPATVNGGKNFRILPVIDIAVQCSRQFPGRFPQALERFTHRLAKVAVELPSPGAKLRQLLPGLQQAGGKIGQRGQ